MGILSNLFGTSNINVTLVAEDGTVATYSVAQGTKLGEFLADHFAGYSPNRYTVKVSRNSVKTEVDADFALQHGDKVSAVIPKNVAGA
jgi:hypothetical protein